MALVVADGIEKTYTGGETPVHALRGVSFTLDRGDFAAVMGPSACGSRRCCTWPEALPSPPGAFRSRPRSISRAHTPGCT